jgi:hypothetical protein
MSIEQMTNQELINLALATSDETIRQQALIEHNQRTRENPVMVTPSGASDAELEANIARQLGSAAA